MVLTPSVLALGRAEPVSLVVLIGASGSGKTTIARAIAALPCAMANVFHFDSIGVPPEEDMIRRHGSGEAWQRAMTVEWMLRLAAKSAAAERILLEGQTRFSFLREGALAAGDLAYVPVLIDCDDATRSARLTDQRQQPELASVEMMNWARFLREQARVGGYPMLDTSALSVSESVQRVLEHF